MPTADRSPGRTGGVGDAGGGVRERLDRVAAATPRGGPAVVGLIGAGLFVVTLVNFVRELDAAGFRWSGVAAVVLGAWLSAIVVYGALYLLGSGFSPRQRWQVAAATVVGLAFVYLVISVTVAVRVSAGVVVGNPVFQLLASAHAGAIAGLVIGVLFVKARQDAREARQVGEQLEFMHGILRHDVLNSMMVVRARAEHLDDRVEGPHRESLEAIRNQAESVIDLAKRARATVDAVAGDEHRSPEPVDLAAVLREEVATARSTFEGLSVSVSCPDDVVVSADDMLPAVVGNLLRNAVDHHDDGDPHVDVDVTVGNGVAVLRVADDGPGIPDERKRTVFDRGTSTSGGGFGLFFVRTMVEYYGGRVRVEDNEPRGAVFVVELPLST